MRVHAACAHARHACGGQQVCGAKRRTTHNLRWLPLLQLPLQAYGNERGLLGGLKVKNMVTGEVQDLPVNGLFFAIGHKPATDFLENQARAGRPSCAHLCVARARWAHWRAAAACERGQLFLDHSA